MNWIRKKYNQIGAEVALKKMASRGNTSPQPVWLYNFWDVNAEERWLTRFIKYRDLLHNNRRVSLYSVFGDKRIIEYDKRDVKIFFTGENVHSPRFAVYSDNMLSEKRIDLAIGFDYIDDVRYIRFPLWLQTQFNPEWSEQAIINHVRQLRFPEIGERNLFAALVARYDWGNTRSQIFNSLEKVGCIQCPSKVLHNDITLKNKFHDDKHAYLRQFCFNICPENTNHIGYVTEKLFDSISAGCIPIYWGSGNQPEPDILNLEAMILWNIGGDNSKNITLIQQLWEKKTYLFDFMHQSRLKEGAENIVLEYFNKLEDSLKSML